MLQKNEFKVYQEICLEPETDIESISNEIEEFSENNVREIVEKLDDQHLVRFSDPDISLLRTRLAEKLRDWLRTEYFGKTSFDFMFKPEFVRKAWYVNPEISVEELTRKTGEPPEELKEFLRQRHIFTRDGKFTTELYPSLYPVVDELLHHHYTHLTKEIFPSSQPTWYDPENCLYYVSTRDELELEREEITIEKLKESGVYSFDDGYNLYMTGADALYRFGVGIQVGGYAALWYSEELPTATEAICHMLLMHNDVETVCYAMAVILKNGIEEETLTETARRYGLEEICREIHDYVTNHRFEWHGDIQEGINSQKLAMPCAKSFYATCKTYQIDIPEDADERLPVS